MSAYQARGRCDRCGAAAKAQVILCSGNQLLFCGHHFDQHRAALDEQAAALIPMGNRMDDYVKDGAA